MMRIKRQKKATYIIWATTAFAGWVTLASGAYGCDIADRLLNELSGAKQALEKQLIEQKRETELLKEKLTKETEAKKSLAQEQTELKTHIDRIKEITGGSGSNTPISERVARLCEEVNLASLAEKKLNEIPGENLLAKIEALKKEKEDLEQKRTASEKQVAEVHAAIGGNEKEVTAAPRVRALSNSLKKNTGSLKEAVGLLEEKLQGLEGEDCISKVDSLREEAERALIAINVLDQKLSDIPGNDLLQKLELLQEGLKLVNTTLETERKEAIGSRAALLDTQQNVQEKEQAYSDLYVEFLNANSQVEHLDRELSKVQVENFEKGEKLNLLLLIQFQSSK